MTAHQPMTFEIGFDDFDLDLLPTDAREIGSDAFRRAVTTYFEGEFADLGGQLSVTFDQHRMLVIWIPAGDDRRLFEQAREHLQRGDLPGAVPILKALVAVEPNNTEAHYNLGMALSDLGAFENAQLYLLKVVHRDPEDVNALVALGVALYRAGDATAARRRIEQALAQDPDNGYAHRGLAAILGNIGEYGRAIAHLREAYRLLPDDLTSVFGLAHALDEFGGEDDRAEADQLYRATIALNPESELGELARQARSRIAGRQLRAAGRIRMDAVMYCLGALELFEQMPPDDVQAVGVEIALLGQRGLDINNPDLTYTLQTISGEFTGLHLMSLMYVAFKQIFPLQDIGFDLSEEYAAALQLYGAKRRQV